MKDTSGPAFPHGSDSWGWNHGMTLRQWYAGLAMQGFLATVTQEQTEDYENDSKVAQEHFAAVAKWCFGYADAMITEAEK